MKQYSLKLWGSCLLLAACAATGLLAAESTSPAASPAGAGVNNRLSLSAVTPATRAAWQQRLTLGPGDLLNISLFDMQESGRTDVPVGPDGRINFLQAREIMASGLTIDELRARLDEALGKYYQNPRTIITPSAFHSKKYFVLGAVVTKGVFAFDRPLTVIEALARAGGLETGLYDLKTVELADLSRSFLVRQGKQIPVSFERLFQKGDLSQNIALEPDDYLYFASATANEIYVLGEVMKPGIVAYAPNPSVIGVIAASGGYSDKAWRSRVLVIRGSLENPETFPVDTSAILKGKAPDFRLQPRDIVYVHANPWIKAEDVLDLAARSFIQGMLVQYTTLHVGPLITRPLLK